MPRFLLSLFFILISFSAYSEDFPFGQPGNALGWKLYDKDTTANAVVLQEYGKGTITNFGDNPLTYYYHVRIKILNKKGFDEGTVQIPLRLSTGGRAESFEGVKAATYTQNTDGTIRTTELDRKNIYREHQSQYRDLVKFAIPNLREGCIIEYSYQIKSPFIFSFHDWEFQTSIPKVQSQFEARIASLFVYKGVLIGQQDLSSTNAHIESACGGYSGSAQIDCSVLEYEMKDIPAFIEEDHMTSPQNYKSAIHFDLSEYYDFRGTKHKVSTEWKDVDQTLRAEEYFGKQISRKGLFKDVLKELTAGKTDELSKAKAIYYYYQHWFHWNEGAVGIYSPDISKAINNHSGSVPDINLTLIAALTAAGINTDAVLLSTRENGVVNKLYPVTDDFNYVVAKVNIGKDSFLLDATEPQLPFGMLPVRCINDQGRVVNNNKASYWMDMKATQKGVSMVIMMLNLQPDGKLTGTWERQSKGYDAYYKRKEIKKFSTEDDYVEQLDEQLSRVKIKAHTIENLDDVEKPLSEKYEIEMRAFDSLGNATLIFSPFVFNKITNPFKLAERTYPVDLGYPSDINLIVNLSFPKGYIIDGKPDYVGVVLPDEGGKFITEVSSTETSFTLSQMIKLGKAIYSSEEYPYLKEFYNRIVQTQKADIVLKKQI